MDNPVSRAEFIAENERVQERLNNHETKIAVLETVVKNLEGLPEAITGLDKTMIMVQANLEMLNSKVDSIILTERQIEKRNEEQDEKIAGINNKSKVDILEFLKSRWWEIVLVVACGIVLFRDYVK